MYVTPSPRWVVLALAVLAAAGCSGGPDKTYPVEGAILYEDGQPAKELAGGSVTFLPLPEEQGRVFSSASIEEDGTFVLSCRAEEDGAVAGKHRVTIEPPGLETQDDDAPRPRPLPAIIDPESAVQEVTVEPRSNEITLKVRRARSAR